MTPEERKAYNHRQANVGWYAADEGGNVYGTINQGVFVALLRDIRDRLDTANERLAVLKCPSFLGIPWKLDRIVNHTAKPRRATRVERRAETWRRHMAAVRRARSTR